jgi:hypothetical protein
MAFPVFAQKKFTPPATSGLDRGYVGAGLLLKDKACARDSVKAAAMSGLEQRLLPFYDVFDNLDTKLKQQHGY